jgi:hypothetical protein
MSRSITSKYSKRAPDPTDPFRTRTITDVVDCSMPAKKRETWEAQKRILHEKKQRYLSAYPDNAPSQMVVDSFPAV